jgi:diacylglycerol kinase family enzyme
MADASNIVETPKERKDYVLTLQTPDGSSEVYVHLHENEDAAQPPTLVNVSKQPRSEPTPKPSDTKDLEIHVVISTGSGHQKATHFFDNVISPVLDTLHPNQTITKHTTQSASSILEFTREIFYPKANNGTSIRIILLSGDGGIVDLVNGLSSQPQSGSYIAPQIVLIPLGTANALYHSINAGKKNTWGISALASKITKPLPVFTATFSPGSKLLIDEARREEDLPTNDTGHGVLHGAVVCSWGMHASLVADSDTAEYRKFGVERFKMAAKEALYPSDGAMPHAYKAKVSLLRNNGLWEALPEQEHMYVLSTLVSNLEGTFCISPASRPLDGSMHLVHFGPTSGAEAMRIMGLAYAGGKHVEDPAVRYEDIKGLKVELLEDEGRWRRVCVDGKIVRVEEGGWVEVRKCAEKRGLDVVIVNEDE